MPAIINNQMPNIDQAARFQKVKSLFFSQQALAVVVSVLVTAVVVGGGTWWWMNGKLEAQQAELEQEVADLKRQLKEKIDMPDTEEVSGTDWKVYRDEEIGIEFQYPPSIGITSVQLIDNTQDSLFSGKSKKVIFGESGVWFGASTKDYTGFIDTSFTGSSEPTCSNQYKVTGNGYSCYEYSSDNERFIIENNFIGHECAISLYTSAKIVNKDKNSIFSGIDFNVRLEDTNKSLENKFDCAEDNAGFDEELITQSKNIITESNLSSVDMQRLNDFKRMLSTFKFIN